MTATVASHHEHQHGPEALATSAQNVDPTRTKTLRKNYGERLRGAFASINAVMREGVQSEDVLGLGTEALAEKPPSFRFETDETKRGRFLAWLRQQLRDEVLSLVSGGENTFVRSAYGRGYQRAATELRKRGVQVDAEDLQTIFNAPQPKRELQRLFTRNFQALKDITEDLDQAISEVLTEGFAAGWNPTKMARKLTDRVDAIGKHRATLLARTETIRAYNAGALDRYERHSEAIDGVSNRSGSPPATRTFARFVRSSRAASSVSTRRALRRSPTTPAKTSRIRSAASIRSTRRYTPSVAARFSRWWEHDDRRRC
jgi:hypothetical protein